MRIWCMMVYHSTLHYTKQHFVATPHYIALYLYFIPFQIAYATLLYTPSRYPKHTTQYHTLHHLSIWPYTYTMPYRVIIQLIVRSSKANKNKEKMINLSAGNKAIDLFLSWKYSSFESKKYVVRIKIMLSSC